MTNPNQPTHADTLAAREMVKARNNSAHWRAIDNGDWDKWGAMQRAYEQLIRQREQEEAGE